MDNPFSFDARTENALAEAPAPSFPLVGLGASAGGVQALQTFFEEMPDKSGMAFVVVMHLSPDHASKLANILQQRTAMPVLQITTTTLVQPNHVYVIPPSKHLSLQNSYIHLVEPQQAAGKRLAIDLFFRTLAATYGPRAIAIVLSGTDGDGTLGIKHVKEQGGITMVQEPTEAEFDSMPRSALATGMVDWVLPVAQMGPQLRQFLDNEARMHIPPEELQSPADAQAEDSNSGGPPAIRKVASATDEEALLEVLGFLRGQTSHDFIHYKRATILRRVARRLQVNLLENIPAYAAFLRTHPEESTSLLHDLLISVTNFFRDAGAFAVLQSYIPQLFADKTASGSVRVWVAGCATGEEAYSIAMLLLEHASQLETPPAIQVFATDMDENAIQTARCGLYPAAIEVDVSTERLRRFFQPEEGGYRVKKELRERVLFSVHNLLKDPPFSRLDLVTCRNLLIYLKRDAQEGIFDLFHFALRSGGLLFLGSAESVADSHAFFAPLDRQQRLFVRRSASRASWQLPALSVAGRSVPQVSLPAAPSPAEGMNTTAWTPALLSTPERRVSPYSELHLSALEQFAPPSILINARYDMVHLSEHAGRFLQMGGEPSRNLLQVVHPALRVELRTALFRALHQHSNVTTVPLLFEEAGTRFVTLHVRPIRGAEPGQQLLLVVFQLSDQPEDAFVQAPDDSEGRPHPLEDEVLHLRDQLSATVEQYEASLEELKAANEEHQSINEEMRSTAEELETSKEELQSTNEELITVNRELKSNINELSRANGDLQNLMASTEIGTIFLDRDLRIKRFTPRIRELFNVIATEIGRPLSDITHKLNYQSFAEDAERVLADLARSEREVQSNGRTFLARMLPYRTPDDYIDGVVLTFIDITQRKQAEAALREVESRMRLIVESASEYAIFTLDLERRVISWNVGAVAIFGYTEAEIMGRTGDILFVPEDRAQDAPQQEVEAANATGRAENERWHLRQDGTRFYGSGLTMGMCDDANNLVGYVKIMRDLTEQKQAADDLRESEEQFRRAVEDAPIPIILHAEDSAVLQISRTWTELTGYELEDVPTFDAWLNTAYGEGADAVRAYMQALLSGQQRRLILEFPIRTRGGEKRHWSFSASAPGRLRDGRRFIVGMAVDITERQHAEEALRASEERYRLIVENIRDYAIFTLDTQGHVTSWNEGARRVKGYENAEILGQHFRVFYTAEDQQAGKPEREMEHAAATGRNEDESWRVRKDGTRFWGNEISSAIRNERGDLQGFVKISRNLSERKHAEEARILMEHETTLLQERNRMAQELHDTLTQGFTGIKMQLEMAQSALQTMPPEVAEAVQRLTRATEIARQSHQEARSSIRALRSPLLENATLVDAFERLTKEVSDDVAVAFNLTGTPYALSALMENDVYRIGQEALTNALRHSAAQHVVVTLTYFEDQVHLTVEDDGRGFDTNGGRMGFGITGMQERTLRLGGQWHLSSQPGKGTQVTLFLPVGPPGVLP